MSEKYDYVVVGGGIGGLFSAALLARGGYRVAVLERHYAPGGYGHSFQKKGYTFCAQLHYIWNCNPGDDFNIFLCHLGLEDKIRFQRLDLDGFDRLRFPSFSYDICSGFDRNIEKLAYHYPQYRSALESYFGLLARINRQLSDLPIGKGVTPFLMTPWKYWDLLRYRNWTTGQLFEKLGLPLEIRSILAGQSGDLLLPASRASLLIHAGMVAGYDSGACVPTCSFEELFGTLVEYINSRPGCGVFLKTWVKSFELEGGKVARAVTAKGDKFEAKHFIHNGDPKRLFGLLGVPVPQWFQRKLDYDYSPSNFTLYLGIKDLDLTRYGFGNWNVWDYAHDDVERCYKSQLDQDLLENPTLFISTPTLHHKNAKIAPEGCHQMVVCTPCRYDHFQKLKEQSRSAYLAEKQRVTNLILDQLERHYIPNLRQHLDLVEAGSPTTNERFVFTPEGNAYGPNLTPKNIHIGKIDYRTPYPNLWQVGAAAGIPSFAAGIHFAMKLYQKLTGDKFTKHYL